jgi:type I restriction enzyme S subunit
VYRPADNVDPRFLCYVVGSGDFIKYAEAASKGVKMPRAEWTELREFRVYRPDIVIQKRIADYLDREIGEIDAMLAKLAMLTEVIQLRKISVIDAHAGIATATETRPLQWFADLVTGSTPKGGGTDSNLSANGTVGWATPEDLQATVAATRFLNEGAVNQMTIVPAGSVLVCCIGATVGKLGFTSGPITTNQQITSAIPREGVDGRYLYYALAAEKEQLLANTVTTTLPIINNARLGSLRIRSCDLHEQNRIADHLDEATVRIDAMMGKMADLRSLLLERRAALITDVVTGRKEIA